jgi:probable phosphoglycerate mutase
MPRDQHVVLVRHGETEWTATGRHTGRTDISLTETGQRQARALGECLRSWRFALALTSPLLRAAETCRLAGLGELAEVREDLREWDYGDYEGRTTPEIRRERPGWTLWTDGVPGGETIEQVGVRADRLVAEVRAVQGHVALFAHGHFLRVLASRWVGLSPDWGRVLALGTATISVLSYERETAVISRWNEPCPSHRPT